MKETIFEQVAAAASVLKLDLSAEEFARRGICAVRGRPGILRDWIRSRANALFLSQRKEAADHHLDFVETEPPSYKGAENL